MSGIRIKLPVKFTNTDLPILLPDPALTRGSLALTEFSGLETMPVARSTHRIDNIAATYATELIPDASPGDLAAQLRVSDVLQPTVAQFERTARGGLHYVNSQTQGAGSQGAQFILSRAVRQYMVTNMSHKFGLWTWIKTTKPTGSPGGNSGQHQRTVFARGNADGFPAMTNQDAAFWLNYGSGMGWYYPSGTTNPYDLSRGGNTEGVTIREAIASKGGMNIKPDSGYVAPESADRLFAGINFGAFGGSGNHVATLVNCAPSFVLYRVYLEDLTVSGRTAAEVDAIDQAAFNAAFAAGGRYHNDTHSAPTTLVP